MQHSLLVEKYSKQLQNLSQQTQCSVLDLACGSGRNGLFLLENNIPVTFADINNEALNTIKNKVNHAGAQRYALPKYWQVDFEQPASDSTTIPHALDNQNFAAIVVFRYLHRPLFEKIKAAISPNGMIIYETFTEQQAEFGRPTNPNFLLKKGELKELFADWQVLHSFEGVVNTGANGESKQAIAQIVAIKPSKK